jgi:hypothetical protein
METAAYLFILTVNIASVNRLSEIGQPTFLLFAILLCETPLSSRAS